MKFATNVVRHYPPHLMHVATLPLEIKNSNFLHIFSRIMNLICYYACSLLYLELSVVLHMPNTLALQHGGVYLVTIDR